MAAEAALVLGDGLKSCTMFRCTPACSGALLLRVSGVNTEREKLARLRCTLKGGVPMTAPAPLIAVGSGEQKLSAVTVLAAVAEDLRAGVLSSSALCSASCMSET